MIRPAPVLRAIAVSAVLAHVWTGFAYCRGVNSGGLEHAGGMPCHAAVPHSHDGHDGHESEKETPWENCPTPTTPHSHDLVLAVFSSDTGSAPRNLSKPVDGLASWIGDLGGVLEGPEIELRTARFRDNLRHRDSSVPRYARFEAFLL